MRRVAGEPNPTPPVRIQAEKEMLTILSLFEEILSPTNPKHPYASRIDEAAEATLRLYKIIQENL